MRLNIPINIAALLIVVIIGAALFFTALSRITIDTDIARSLPTGDPFLFDGFHIFEKNPVKDRVGIDIGMDGVNVEKLQAVADAVETHLSQSGLFALVDSIPMQRGLAELADRVVQNLPVLFTAGELQHQVAPLLTDNRIRIALERVRNDLHQLDGIGQAGILADDPLGLRHIVLARLADRNPDPGTEIHRGRFLSADRRHLLVWATPKGPGTDTAVARPLSRFFAKLQKKVARKFGPGVTLTPAGAYRAALDDEAIVIQDARRAILWAAAGIGILLLTAFSRPLAGILALLPALAGTVMSFFVFALIRDTISIMVLGFGGAVISITAGHGMAYLLFVDSGHTVGRKQASREIRSIGLPAVLTAMGAFGVLAFSGVAVFEQLGWFTAMGIGFAFVFVHTVFPKILQDHPVHAPTPRRRFSHWVDRLASCGKPGALLALLAGTALAAFMPPHFDVDLRAMNSVSRETHDADELMTAVWGDIFAGVCLVAEADDPQALQDQNDRLLEQLDTEAHAGGIQKPVISSLFFPGRDRCAENGAAWKRFWSPERIRTVSATVIREGIALGFTHHTFAPFLGRLAAAPPAETSIPPNAMPLLGIFRDDADGRWRQVTRIRPRERFDNQRFFARLTPLAAVSDPALSSRHMGRLLFTTFVKMLLIIGTGLVVLLLLFFADWGLLLAALLPLVFAIVCTLGTLGLMGRPLDIPALMLSVAIMGLGVGYTLSLVRGYQRYQCFAHPHFAVARMAVFLAAGSTLVGFSVLLTAGHGLLKSAGWISLLGIGYCLVGAALILPPLLKRRFEGSTDGRTGIESRYRNMEPYPRMFARFRRRLDPLFDELAKLAPQTEAVVNILDVGSGYGVPACWLADRYPEAVIHGIEPQAERVRVAALALGSRGQIQKGAAPDLPAMDVLLDLATLLDMSHYLQDWELEKTLERVHERLLPGGCLIMRSVLPASARPRWTWHLEQFRIRVSGLQACYRDAATVGTLLSKCGFEVVDSGLSG